MMNFWIKVGALAAAVILIFNAGYFIKGKFEEAEQADILRQQIVSQQMRQDELNEVAHRLEDFLANERKKSANLQRKWSAIRAENPASNPLDDSRIGLLRDATSPADDATR